MTSSTDPDLPPLLVLAPDDPWTPQIAAQVAALFPGQAVARFADLDSAVGAGGDAAIILPVTHPAEAIARHLAVSGSVDAALTGWKAGAELLLAAARRVRRRLRLVDARALVQGAARVHLEVGAVGPAGAKDSLPPPLPVFLVIAQAALLHDSDALRMADEIAALRRGDDGCGLTAGSCQAALDACLQAAAADQRAARLQDELARLEADANLLDAEANLLRESLALLIAGGRGAADGSAQGQAADGKRPVGTRLLRDVSADLKLQTARVQALQRQLDTATEQAARREAILAAILLREQQDLLAGAALQARTDQLQDELHSVYASKSWRMTAPLRALRARG